MNQILKHKIMSCDMLSDSKKREVILNIERMKSEKKSEYSARFPDLRAAFIWNESPQGNEYWEYIDDLLCGNTPKLTKASLRVEAVNILLEYKRWFEENHNPPAIIHPFHIEQFTNEKYK